MNNGEDAGMRRATKSLVPSEHERGVEACPKLLLVAVETRNAGCFSASSPAVLLLTSQFCGESHLIIAADLCKNSTFVVIHSSLVYRITMIILSPGSCNEYRSMASTTAAGASKGAIRHLRRLDMQSTHVSSWKGSLVLRTWPVIDKQLAHKVTL